jgi:hypothetical protein
MIIRLNIYKALQLVTESVRKTLPLWKSPRPSNRKGGGEIDRVDL